MRGCDGRLDRICRPDKSYNRKGRAPKRVDASVVRGVAFGTIGFYASGRATIFAESALPLPFFFINTLAELLVPGKNTDVFLCDGHHPLTRGVAGGHNVGCCIGCVSVRLLALARAAAGELGIDPV